MLLRANVLLRPTSGVRPALVDALVGDAQRRHGPAVPEQGSVGASGDLAPLSHIALALMGEGEVLDPGAAPTAAALAAAGLKPFRFAPEGRTGVHQRDPGADRTPGPAGARRPGALADRGRRGGDEPRGAARHAGPAGSPHPRRPAASRADRSRRADAAAPRGQRDPRITPGGRPPGPGRLQPALRAPRCSARWPTRSVSPKRRSAVELNASTDNPLVFENGDVISGGISMASRWPRRSISWR